MARGEAAAFPLGLPVLRPAGPAARAAACRRAAAAPAPALAARTVPPGLASSHASATVTPLALSQFE